MEEKARIPTDEELAKDYPSLKLVYEEHMETLTKQGSAWSSIDSKVTGLLTAGIAIIGIGLPLGVQMMQGVSQTARGPLLYVAAMPVIVFLALVTLSICVVWPRWFHGMRDPQRTRENGFWSMTPTRFYYENLGNIEDDFKDNEEIIAAKEKLFRPILLLAVTQAVSVGAWFVAIATLLQRS